MHVSQAAVLLVDAVKTHGDSFLVFNGLCLAADKFSTVEGLCESYDKLSEIRRKEYLASPEGIERTRKDEATRSALQHRANQLSRKLPLLDFNNVDGLLDWLCEMEDPRDRIGVQVNSDLIREVFEGHGYKPNANVGNAFNENDRENYARWIIGQAIAPVYVPMVRSFTEKYRLRFPEPRLGDMTTAKQA